MPETIISAGTVLPTPSEVIKDGAVLVRGSQIAAVGPYEEVARQAPDAVRRDFPASTVLPGLINAHVHLAFDATPDFLANFEKATDDEVRQGALDRLGQLARSGVTTVRDLGDRSYVVLGLEEVDGLPRVLSAGVPLTVKGGHCHFFGGEVTTDDEIVALVDKNAAAGAHVIKVMASGGQITPGGAQMWESQFDPRQLTLIVRRANEHGLPVAAHAHGADAIEAAVAAGASTIEHCTWLVGPGQMDRREHVARRMAANGVFACPTTSPGWRRLLERLGEERARPVYERLSWLRDQGVRLAAGSDAGLPGAVFDDVVTPTRLYEWLGFSRTEILDMLTVNAAAAVGLGAVTGRLEAGYAADILVVAGNPLDDLAALGNVEFVTTRGR